MQRDNNYIDIKRIVDYLLSKWLFFAVSVSICLLLAVLYLRTTPGQYQVAAKVQLKDISVSEKRPSDKNKFFTGLELVVGNAELEDEIGILSSFSMIKQALERLDITVSYFKSPSILGAVEFPEEVLQAPFGVILDESQPQMINVPVYIKFLDPYYYTVTFESENAKVFDIQQDELLAKNITVEISETVSIDSVYTSPYLSFQLVVDSMGINYDDPYFFMVNSLDQVTKKYSDKLKISPISKESNIVNVAYTSPLPDRGVNFINTLVDVYIQNDLEKKNRLGLKTIEFLDGQLGLVYDSLKNVESNLQSFRASNQIIDIPTTSENLTQQLQELEEDQARLRVQNSYFKNTLANLKRDEAVIDVVAPSSVDVHDPFLNNLLIQLSELNKEKIEKSYSSNENNPVLKVLERKISTIKENLFENINNLIISSDLAIADNRRRINVLSRQLNQLPESERDLINIERKFDLNDNLYNYLLERRAEASIAIASNLSDKTVVDYARLTSNAPVSPNKKLILAAALVLGFAIPLMVIIGHLFFKQSIVDKDEIKELTDNRIIGTIQDYGKKWYKVGVATHKKFTLEPFQFLVVNLEQFYTSPGHKVIGVTSLNSKEGKTFCSINLAKTFALSGKKTLVIDADPFKGNLSRYFSNKKDPYNIIQLNKHLNGFDPTERDSLVNKSSSSNLYFASFPPNGEAQNLIGKEGALDNLFRLFRREFDVIIVDTLPFTASSNYFIMSPYFDINLVVLRYNYTSKQMVERSMSSLERDNVKNVNIVFNGVKPAKMKEYGHMYY